MSCPIWAFWATTCGGDNRACGPSAARCKRLCFKAHNLLREGVVLVVIEAEPCRLLDRHVLHERFGLRHRVRVVRNHLLGERDQRAYESEKETRPSPPTFSSRAVQQVRGIPSFASIWVAISWCIWQSAAYTRTVK